jgi:hypothetical protein
MKTTTDEIRAQADKQSGRSELGKITFHQDEKGARYEGIADRRITSIADLVEFFKIDLTHWKIKASECSVYESHTRVRHYDTEQVTSHNSYARIDDEHKVVPLYRVWVRLEENRPLILLNDVKSDIMADLKKFAPKYKRIQYRPVKEGHLLEINLFDLHFGKLVWDQEAGENFDVKIARDVFERTIATLLAHAQSFPLDRIVFPIGNDFFNVDNEQETTTRGTPQDEDTRWKKTFLLGRRLLVETIDKLRELAPLDIPIIPGNHDQTRAFFLGDSLECWYHNCPGVTVDNGAKLRKYYRYGSNLIGYTHGKDEKPEDLPQIMATEAPKLWADTKYREWHIGDKHHLKQLSWKSAEEFKGVVVRVMRSLTSTDAWHFKKGYVGSIRAGEAFIWNKQAGPVCQLTATI